MKQARTSWGTSVSFPLPNGCQALLMIGHNNLIQIWRAGGTTNTAAITGSAAGLTFSYSDGICKVTSSSSVAFGVVYLQ